MTRVSVLQVLRKAMEAIGERADSMLSSLGGVPVLWSFDISRFNLPSLALSGKAAAISIVLSYSLPSTRLAASTQNVAFEQSEDATRMSSISLARSSDAGPGDAFSVFILNMGYDHNSSPTDLLPQYGHALSKSDINAFTRLHYPPTAGGPCGSGYLGRSCRRWLRAEVEAKDLT
ncbi:hypothetical protein BD311DRAFT_737515 [Dichomitus squalens]|uniref:Uncharacterized protein n=1 Tax=Dichomitus squalens TaxID=114155 RepID=A0A4Q9MXP9_9APHY|nr:hypothetical protein BD311DRAFT_737515 [Dichomitus squalens]